MNEDILKGKWKEIKGGIKEKWGRLTDDEITRMEGREDQIIGTLQKKYGYSEEEARREYDSFIEKYRR
ncbi:MAG: CsbD family protein [Syntrophorhabdus sp.]